ncbi:MAG: hypothetical protein JWR34_3171, partial [Mycobacterium sp.]|nr:hypothetical protein [Mycobacterium sp.]
IAYPELTDGSVLHLLCEQFDGVITATPAEGQNQIRDMLGSHPTGGMWQAT